jgi:NADH:ubiquinone reductase (H+-translocating)
MTEQSIAERPRVVIIGAGFGGLEVAMRLGGKPVDVLLLDRNNYHGFWPLLYQVATAGLEPQQIAQPVRAIVRRWPNIRFQLATVASIDRARKLVISDRGNFRYDELVVAPGSATNFYGLQSIREQGFELKDVPDALALRNHLITRFEQAVTEIDAARLQQLLTFVVVGGGPTGVEVAGAMMELIRHVLRKDYPMIDFSRVRVLLLEAADRILLAFPPGLSRTAERRLRKIGVEVCLGVSVVSFERGELHFKDGGTLPTETVIWAAGIQGAPLGATLGVELQRGARVPVTPELHLPDDPHVWVIGDLAHLDGPDGKPYPQLATVAMQQGRLAARNILGRIQGQPLRAFRYVDKGSMATIGRRSAVARIWNLSWSGPIAWLLWLAVHLFYLIGFRNRLMVLINWAYNYFTYDRGARALVTISRPPALDTAAQGASDGQVAKPVAIERG